MRPPRPTSTSDPRRRAAPGIRPAAPPTEHGETFGDPARDDVDAAGAAGVADRVTGSGDGAGARSPVMVEAAREMCLRWLTVRARTRHELAAALRRRAIPDAVSAEVLDRLTRVGLVDDRAFAEAWVTGRAARGIGRARLTDELRRRGVGAPDVAQGLAALDDVQESVGARQVADRALARSRGLAREVRLRRAVAAVSRRGYPGSVALAAVRGALAAETDDPGHGGAGELADDGMADASG